MTPSDETKTQIWLGTAMAFLIIAAAVATHFRPPDTSGEHSQLEPLSAELQSAELQGAEPGCDLLEDMCHETCAHVALPYLRYVEHGCMCGGTGSVRFIGLEAAQDHASHGVGFLGEAEAEAEAEAEEEH